MSLTTQPALPVLNPTADTVVWGFFDASTPAVFQIQPGQVMQVHTVSMSGVAPGELPVEFFGRHGIPAEQVLPELEEIQLQRHRWPQMGPHVVTGPIYVEGAEPGDQLEVRVLDIAVRTPFGVNHTRPGLGVLPELLAEPSVRVIPFNQARTHAHFSDDITVPLHPFLGIMGVAPPPDQGQVNSIPPGAWGGNLDVKQLTVGSTLYLPVFNPGALFFAGDGHAAQGNGEVNLTAIEASLTATLEFRLHKGQGQTMTSPRAETASHYILMGLDADLNRALQLCVQATVEFLQQQHGMAQADAYALCSIGVDFEIAEAVNQVKLVYAMVPKALFRQVPPYWAQL